MSGHDYENSVGLTFRDRTLTREDLTVEQIAQFIQEKRIIISSTIWGRYRHKARHRPLNFLQRAYANWLLAWTQMAY
jgi:hypothetical protein